MTCAVDSKINCKVRVKLAVCEDVYGSEEGVPRVHNVGTKCDECSASRPDSFTPIQYWVGDWVERRFGLDAAGNLRFCDAARLLCGRSINWAAAVSVRGTAYEINPKAYICARRDTFMFRSKWEFFWTRWRKLERRLFLTVEEVWIKPPRTSEPCSA
jgi:hypothetical protein